MSSGLFTAGTGNSGVFVSGNGVSGCFTNLLEGFCGRSAPARALRGRLFSDVQYTEPKSVLVRVAGVSRKPTKFAGISTECLT